MQRRTFVKSSLAAAAAAATSPAPGAASPAPPAAGRAAYELRTYELRNDLDVARAHAFVERALIPALRRAGAGPVGAFAPDTGLPTASLVLLVPFASMADAGAASERLAADAAYREASDAWERGGGGAAGGGSPNGGSPNAAPVGLPYVRYDVALYRAFAGHPQLEVPPAAAGRAGRVFELRTYEAPSEAGLRNKVAMFDQEEIKVFRDSGFAPVFFGEAVAGARLPHLTYLVGFDDMAARTAAWGRFVASPDWQRIRGRPGWTDPEAVSNIRSAFLRPLGFSAVR